MMSPQTVKLLMMFFLATALLNITNYLFYLLYDPPSHQAMKMESWKTGIIKFTTPRRIVRSVRWTAFLIAKDNPSPTVRTPLSEVKTAEGDGDYRDQSFEVSHLYEYRGLDKCPQKPPDLGPMNIDDVISLEAIEKLYDTLGLGGVYEETACTARQSVAIIIPNNGQKNELLKYLYTLHPFLMKQQLDYQIFVVEQNNSRIPMNYGKMLNAGFNEAQRIQRLKKDLSWSCIVFHELALMPLDSRNLYRCSRNPHLLVTVVNNRSYEYEFGGAVAINPTDFTKVNGFSNLYTENEAVYEDLSKRLLSANYSLTRSTTFGKYSYLKHSVVTNKTKLQLIQTSSPLNLIDGLSTLSYKLDSVDLKPLYTLIKLSLDSSPKNNVTEKIWNKLLNQATISTWRSSKETSSSGGGIAVSI